ncbi:MAG TPA: efflux RND transporter periplasmic adaptor subunit [Tepidisphaeraceae bacterium]|nr:efflux RND transporter periplasmic adaptor subunit [Tepidisphaeraceae bacterium]
MRFVSLMAMVGAGLSGCNRAPPTPSAPPPAPVVVTNPVKQSVTEYDEFTGRTAAKESVEIRAQISGYISSVAFQDGARVAKGDLLFQIDDRPFTAQLARAQAEVARVTAALERARNELARAAEPFKTGAVSAQEYDNLQQSVKGNEAQLAAAEADVQSAELNVGYCKVTAPIEGRVSRPLVTAGNLVSSQTSLTSLVSITPMDVYFEADERTMLFYQAKAAAQDQRPEDVKARNIPVWMARATDKDFPFTGILDFVDNTVDERTGTIKLRAVYDNSQGVLVPGLFVRARMRREVNDSALVIPEKALGNDQGNRFVFVVDAENTVQYRPVEAGGLTGSMRVIRSGLSESDQVIVEGLQRARAGAKVAPTRQPAASQPSAN